MGPSIASQLEPYVGGHFNYYKKCTKRNRIKMHNTYVEWKKAKAILRKLSHRVPVSSNVYQDADLWCTWTEADFKREVMLAEDSIEMCDELEAEKREAEEEAAAEEAWLNEHLNEEEEKTGIEGMTVGEKRKRGVSDGNTLVAG
jgi:hypothetical protein